MTTMRAPILYKEVYIPRCPINEEVIRLSGVECGCPPFGLLSGICSILIRNIEQLVPDGDSSLSDYVNFLWVEAYAAEAVRLYPVATLLKDTWSLGPHAGELQAHIAERRSAECRPSP